MVRATCGRKYTINLQVLAVYLFVFLERIFTVKELGISVSGTTKTRFVLDVLYATKQLYLTQVLFLFEFKSERKEKLLMHVNFCCTYLLYQY